MSSNILITQRNQDQILIRADLNATDKALAEFGLVTPDVRMRLHSGEYSVMWMSPDELLLFVDDATKASVLKAHLPPKHLVHDVTGARVVFTLEGEHIKDMIRKGSPRDIDSLPLNEVVRTRIGQIAVAFWFLTEDKVELVCFRSVAEYVENWFMRTSREGSLPVI